MRTIIAVVIALVTGIASAAWIQVGAGTGPAKVSVDAASALGATVTIEVPGIETESVAINGAQYLKLAIPGAVSAGLEVGKPEVPAVPVLLARPTGSTVTLRILSMQTETLHVANVFPMQPSLKLGEQAGPLAFDSSFYASDVEYPSDRLSSPITATWRDLDVVNIHVYPVAVRPAQHEVVVTSRITFRADFSGGDYPATVTSRMQPVYRSLIQNYDGLRLATAAQEPPGTKCLVFCYKDYYTNDSLLSLLDLMTKLGDSTELIYVDAMTCYMIKDTIMSRWYDLNKALRWVLLVGEFGQIPPRLVSTNQGQVYSDYWYSDLVDTNHLDSCDMYPEVGIARLSPSVANGDQDLRNQIAKIKAYMMGTYADTWLNKITLVAHKDPSPDSAVIGAQSCSLHFYEGTRDMIRGCSSVVRNTHVNDAIERGTGVLIYLGHGLDSCWGQQAQGDSGWNTANQCWTSGDVDTLNNDHYTPVVFNIACQCGDLSKDTCLSEAWMRKYPGGAVASFGSSGLINQQAANAQCSVAVKATRDYADFDSLHLGRYVAPVFDLGGIQMLMAAYLATAYGCTTAASNIYGCMWLGNPAMPVWSGGPPQTAEVSYPLHIPIGQDSFLFQCSVKAGNGQGFENARVCAYKPDPDGFYVVGLTDSTGEVTLPLTTSSVGSFYVSASEGHVAFSNHNPSILHTPMLPFLDSAEVYDSTPDMTYPNWSRKLVHGPTGNRLHVVYTGGGSASDSVFYTRSTDYGTTWSTPPEPIGAGVYPAIILNDSVPVPWVVYLTSDSSIVRAIRSDTGASASWDEDTIFKRNDSARAGAPSLAARVPSTPPSASVAYPVYVQTQTDTNNFIYYNMFTAAYIAAPETVDAAGDTFCYGPSIVVNPGLVEHVAWVKGQSIYYSQHLNPAWPGPYQISSPTGQFITEPASNPSMEAYGDSVFCVWRGPNEDGDSLYGDIWRRPHCLNWQPQQWPRLPSNQSQTPDMESDFPVMATSFLTVWQEQVSPDSTEIWYRSLGSSGPDTLFPGWQFRYPQVDGYWFPNQSQFRCNTVWTKQTDSNPPQYDREFGWKDWVPQLGKGLGPSPREDYEPASYYAAELGQPERSPYCLSRGGFAKFDSWDMDTSGTVLSYRLPYLDPRMVYKLRAVMYHRGKENWDMALRCDSGPWQRVRVAPNVPDTFWLQVPKALYKSDARIIVDVARMTGGYVSLARLKLFQTEEQPGDDGGVQGWGTGMTYVTRLRGCSPNPFTRGTSVNYELAQYGPVDLTVHDVSGRLVRQLESGPRQRGIHAVCWDGSDGRGRVVPSGVYFVRFSAGSKVSTGRLTLVR